MSKFIKLLLVLAFLLYGCNESLDALIAKKLNKPSPSPTVKPSSITPSGNPLINPSTSPSDISSTSVPGTNSTIKSITVKIPTNFALNTEYTLKAEIKFLDGTTNDTDIIWNISDTTLAKLEGDKLTPLKEGNIAITAIYKNDSNQKSDTVYAMIRSDLNIAPSATPLLDIPLPTPTPSQFGMFINPIVPQNGKISVDIYKDFQYVPEGWPMGLSVGQTQLDALASTPYETLTNEPQYTSANHLYGYLSLGNGADTKISFAVDNLDQPTWMVYMDKNNNEDLTDDGSYINQGTGSFAALMSVTIDIVTSTGLNITQPYQFWMWINAQKQAYFYTRCYYKGMISINNTTYHTVAYEEYNHNGLYKENGLYIDLNNDGIITEATEHFTDGQNVQIGTEQYQLELLYP